MSHVLSISAGLFLMAFIYVLGTLTTALLIAHSECHSLWWAVWFGVWLFAPLSRIRRQDANHGALLIYWDLAVFVSYSVIYSSLWTLIVCAVILVLCSFYLLLSLVEVSASDDLYFEREAQGTLTTHAHDTRTCTAVETRSQCSALIGTCCVLELPCGMSTRDAELVTELVYTRARMSQSQDGHRCTWPATMATRRSCACWSLSGPTCVFLTVKGDDPSTWCRPIDRTPWPAP
jgi:hypothetical protein